jgi:hypothetical protein
MRHWLMQFGERQIVSVVDVCGAFLRSEGDIAERL